MLKAFKTEIKPTEEQKIKIHKTIGTCRFLYNLYIAKNQEQYQEDKTFMSGFDFDKWINNDFSKQNDYYWIKEVSSKARKKSIMNAESAFKRFFKGISRFPKFKKKSNQDVKAYFPKNNKTDWTVERHRVKIPTLGWVRLKEYAYIPMNEKIKSGTVSLKAGRYYVSVLIEVEDWKADDKKTTSGIGIDLGLKTLAVTSNGQKFKNINKSACVRKLEKKLKREQRKLSRKYEQNKKRGGTATAYRGKNIDKQKLKVQKLHQKLTNIRNDHINKIVFTLVKTKPEYITVEDLNIGGMMKNKHLAEAIAKLKLFYFKTKLKEKCQEFEIELRYADRLYPSSKKCSACGEIKKDLKLKDRTYVCDHCGAMIDRDENAAINLAKYPQYTLA